MSSIFKKAALAGIGLTITGKDKIEKLVNEMAERGDLKKEEMTEALEDFLEKSEEIKASLEEKIKTVVDNSLLANSKKIEELSNRVEELEKKLRENS